MRTSFHHQPEAQHPKSLAIHKLAGRLPHLLGPKRTLPQSSSPKTKRGGSRRVSRSCQAFFKMLSLRPQPGEEFRHANDDKNHFGGLLNWCSGNWHTHTCQRSILSTARLQPPSPTGGRRRRRLPLRPSFDMGWMPPGVDGSGPPIVTIRYWEEYCARCKGPGGGFWNGYWNGCPPSGYSVREIRRIRRNGGY
jgi:hypothetical protein